MKNKKNIDQLFKERFQNLETPPPTQSWENIEAQLNTKKKDRKVIPIWWKLGGVAAGLVLLLSIGNFFLNSPEILNNTTVVDETTETDTLNKNEELKKDTPNLIDKKTHINSAITDETTSNDIKSNTHEQKGHSVQKSEHKAATYDVATVGSNSQPEKNTSNSTDPDNISNITTDDIKKLHKNNKELIAQIPEQTTVKENEINSSTGLIKDKIKKTHNTDKKIAQIHKNGIAKENKENAVADNTNINKEDSNLNKDEKQSIFDAIEETEEAVAVEEKPINRWEVAPNIAPVYYSSLGEGSSIDPTFADNSQSGDVNISYGVHIAYQINNRLSIRSGVSNVTLSYGTSGLELGTGDPNAALQSINYNDSDDGIVLTAVDKGTIASANPQDPFGNLKRKATSGDVILTQNISYLEVPTELKYKLIDRKLGIDLIGGFSTLFLGDNEVSVAADDFNSVLGEANNLNDVSFTTNIGLGVNYQLSRRLRFNVEPTFKYQLNPYSNSNVNFSPYYIGVYSGLSLKF